MSPVVSVLTPNIKTAEEYKNTLRRLSEIGIDHIEHDYDISVDEWQVIVDSTMVYGLFSQKAFRKGRGLFMTREEIRAELWRFEAIDETINSLVERQLLRVVHMEWPPKRTPLCPFCGKPFACPMKKRKLLLFTKISAWSCRNELCSMCGKQYVL